MFGAFRIPGPAARTKIFAVWRAILVLVFSFSLEGTGRMTAVQAAPLRQDSPETHYILAVYPPEAPICVGQKREIRVKLVSSRNVFTPGKPNANYEVAGLTGIQIEASVQDGRIGTLTPEHLLAGWDVEQAAPGEAYFTFTAKKAGKTNLIFEALVPARITGTVEKYLGPMRSIEVVNCRYKVTAFIYSNASYPNLRSSLISKTVGEMKSSNGQNFTGTTNTDWNAASFSVRCSHSHKFSSAQAQLSGSMNQDQLSVKITFDPASFSSQNCASSNSGQLVAPPLETTVSSSGGSQRFSYSIPWGMEALKGTASILVTPIADK